jgi:transposase
MSNLFWLTDAQMARLQPFFPKSHGKPRVDDRPVLSGIIFINCNGLRWRDAPKEYGPPKTLYNRCKRWSDKGVFARMMAGLAAEAAVSKTVMIDVRGMRHWFKHAPASISRRVARRPACGRKWGPGDQRGRLIGRTKGGMNTKRIPSPMPMAARSASS